MNLPRRIALTLSLLMLPTLLLVIALQSRSAGPSPQTSPATLQSRKQGWYIAEPGLPRQFYGVRVYTTDDLKPRPEIKRDPACEAALENYFRRDIREGKPRPTCANKKPPTGTNETAK